MSSNSYSLSTTQGFFPSQIDAMALTSIVQRCSSKSLHSITKRFLSSFLCPPPRSLTRFISPSLAAAIRFTPIRFMGNYPGNSPYASIMSGGGNGYGDYTPQDTGPLFPGCDYRHWLVVMDNPGGPGANIPKEQLIDYYIQTLSKALGSEEVAKRRIYSVSCDRFFGFGCELDEEIANTIGGIPGVLCVLPDSYVDAENKDYGNELFDNGRIVERPPERERRANPELPTVTERYRSNARNHMRRKNFR